ncbi:hypothetical protein Leryth_026509 [Lithospermum erythrorhizon]|nr:hypothetical protein Leryth_026509 [Lithospermum erythrorhizon]
MNAWHEIELKVRDYELDQYGVVNNGVYSSYCQLGHHEIFQMLGINSFGMDSGEAVAVAELSLNENFKQTARLSFQHLIFNLPNQQPILEANSTRVWVDKNYRPVRIPPAVRSKINQFINNLETNKLGISGHASIGNVF